MQLARMIAIAATASVIIAGCGGPDAAVLSASSTTGSLKGDDVLIAAAQKISDAIGGCVHRADAQLASKVVGLENGSIVMIGCSQGEYSFTQRLFAAHGADEPKLLALPDYGATGWVASDQAAMAELDAGSGVLTTLRKGAVDGGCGSEGRYQWDGAQFVLQELRWQDCADPEQKGSPFPVIWPTQLGAAVDPNGATPAP
jgi:Protein of unknown function (DUF1176)